MHRHEPERADYFNPRSPCGERPPAYTAHQWEDGISIRAPLAGSDTVFLWCLAALVQFQSALPLRGATDDSERRAGELGISIRAPLAGSDAGSSAHMVSSRFQSALPLRGATATIPFSICSAKFQSALPLRGATCAIRLLSQHVLISIRAPLAGSDPAPCCTRPARRYFNPRSPCGERRVSARLSAGWSHFNPRSPCGERR